MADHTRTDTGEGLPTPTGAIAPNGRMVKWDDNYLTEPWLSHGYVPLYTAEQVRQAQREARARQPDTQPSADSGCRITGGICACRSGGSFGGCARERAYCCTNEPVRATTQGAAGQPGAQDNGGEARTAQIADTMDHDQLGKLGRHQEQSCGE